MPSPPSSPRSRPSPTSPWTCAPARPPPSPSPQRPPLPTTTSAPPSTRPATSSSPDRSPLMTDAPRSTGTDTAPPLPIGTIDLAIGGMTCASCVARVEKKLNKVPGAEALVNLATETARVTLTEDVDVATLVAAVESAGYTARVTRRDMPHAGHGAAGSAGAKTLVGLASGPAGAAGRSSTADRAPVGDHSGHESDEMALSGHSMTGHDMEPDEDTSAPEPDRGEDLKRRLRLAVALSVPVVLVSMIPALQFRGWQWVVAVLAVPVVTWSALPFHRAAWRAGKHGASTMDTLVSLGIVAATTWSLWALLFGGAHSDQVVAATMPR